MVGMAEVEIDKETGSVELIDYVAVVDCGTPINQIWRECRPKEELHRELVWRYLKISSILRKVQWRIILLCSIRFQVVSMLEKFGLNLSEL